MLAKISENIWKISADSNAYFLDLEEKIVIDTGRRSNRRLVLEQLSKVVDLKDVSKVIFTHLHYDHIGNFDIFPNAGLYASSEEIEAFKKDPLGAVLSEEDAERLSKAELHPLKNMDGLKIILTPGHTIGSVCIFYEKERILFSGDTFFYPGCYGRTDLPTSVPDKMPESLRKISKLKARIICPGHDY